MTDTHIKIHNVVPRVQYVGNGVTTQFNYTFEIFASSNMKVYLGDELQTTGYTVYGAGENNGGHVDFTTAPASGVKVTLLRNVPIERITDFQEGGTFRPKNLNDDFDRQTAFVQQVSEELDRAVKVGPTSSTDPEEVLLQVNRIYDSIDNVDTVADNISNVNAVRTNINSVNNCSTNMSAIQDAPTQASNAATSATNANIWAEGTDAQVQAIGGVHSARGWQALSHAIQLSTMPTASAAYLNDIYQYVGTTDSTYTNGYFYKCSEIVVTEPVSESLNVTQTAGVSMGSFTTDVSVFKSALNPNGTFTFTFSCVGRPLQISLSKYDDGFQFTSLTRDTIYDNNQQHIYSWVDGSNTYFFTTTEIPNEETIFYVGSTDDISQPTNVNSGWEYVTTNTRRTDDPWGMWIIGGDDEEISLSDYGIYSSSRGVVGNVLSVAYIAPVIGESTFSWQNIDAQPTHMIGEIIQIACTSDYIPTGCLPCDGAEYTKAQFNELWTNYLTSSPAKLLTCSYADYQTDITTYGQCAKFAIDTTNNKFKVPTIKDGAYITQAKSNSELGKSYNESLPNIKGKIDNRSVSGGANGAFIKGTSISGNYAGTGNNSESVYAIDFDASRSSSTYQDNAKVQGDNVRMRFFVVVSNGQINQASMDWSQWATSLAGRLDTNASNATATGKSTIVGWGMPDLSRQYQTTITTTPVQAQYDLFIHCSYSNGKYVYVNTTNTYDQTDKRGMFGFLNGGSSEWQDGNCFVAKGCWYYSNSTIENAFICPLKGE